MLCLVYVTTQKNPLRGEEIATLKMVKRQLFNFESGSTAQMKLVFICAQRVKIRWFLFDAAFDAINAEVPNMLPLEGIVKSSTANT